MLNFYPKCVISMERTFRPRVPYTPADTVINGKLRRASTGNMRFNATKIRAKMANVVEIKVDARIAPYVVYTNEPWISPRWKGAQNPNEKWFERAVDAFAKDLAARLKGKLIKQRN